MHTYRERPDVELWVLCRPEAAYFLWRLGKRQPKQEGQLRSDVCAVAAFFAHCGAKNAAILAVQMMGTNDEAMLQKVVDLKAEMAS